MTNNKKCFFVNVTLQVFAENEQDVQKQVSLAAEDLFESTDGDIAVTLDVSRIITEKELDKLFKQKDVF